MRSITLCASHVVPPPNFLHTAICIGTSDATNESLGGIVVHGEYYSDGKYPTYLSCDGARSFIMPLKRFKEEFEAFNIINLIPQRNTSLLTADDYKWTTHNCQHFSAICLDILKARCFKTDKYDWTRLPSNIMKVIRINEITY